LQTVNTVNRVNTGAAEKYLQRVDLQIYFANDRMRMHQISAMHFRRREMSNIRVDSKGDGFTSISNNFIDFYMGDANGDFVKVYLYLLRACSEGKEIEIASIADSMGCTEKDVCRAVRYWIGKDLVELRHGELGELIGITLLSPKIREVSRVRDDLSLDTIGVSISVSGKKVSEESEESYEETPSAPRKKTPTAEQLSALQTDDNIANLIIEANVYCKRNITQKDVNTLIYIYDQLGFSFDLCEYLLEYCAMIGKTSFSYIEAVAKNWYENSITTRDEAEEFSVRYFGLYSRIMKELGLSSKRQVPAPVEREYIDKWYGKYGFSDVIIIEACRRAVMKNPSGSPFAYVDGILTDWYNAGVKTLSDVEKKDESHKTKAAAKKTASKAPSRANDFPQTDMSDKLKEIENFYLSKVDQDD